MTNETPQNDQTDEDSLLSTENEGLDEAVGHPRAEPHPLEAAYAALEKERDVLKENMLRALAETDNVRKRANRQIEEARLYAVEKFARDLLNVSDNLARAVEAVIAPSAPPPLKPSSAEAKSRTTGRVPAMLIAVSRSNQAAHSSSSSSLAKPFTAA